MASVRPVPSNKLASSKNKQTNVTEIKKTEKAVPKRNIVTVGSMDYTLFITVLILVFVGVIMVFSASYLNASNREAFNYDMFYFIKKQAVFAAIGICGMILLSGISYVIWKKFSFIIYAVCNILLLIVPFTSDKRGGAYRWISIPIIGDIQPSEISKLGVILFVSLILANNRNLVTTWKGLIKALTIVFVTTALVGIQNMSTAIIIAFMGTGIIFVASPHVTRFIVMAIGGVSSIIFFIVVISRTIASAGSGWRFARFEAWLDPFGHQQDKGFQTVQSLLAIGSGGIFGLGLGQSRQKTFVPEPHNDFIFSIICEELGLIGAALVLGLFIILIWRGLTIAMNAPDLFSSYLATGIVLMIAAQVMINVGVVTNSIPNTGVTLPFISYGGTSLIIVLCSMGILLNISRYYKHDS